MALGGSATSGCSTPASDFAQAGITSAPTTWAQLPEGRRQIDRPLGPPLRLLRADRATPSGSRPTGTGAVGRRGQPPQQQPDQGRCSTGAAGIKRSLTWVKYGPVAVGSADGSYAADGNLGRPHRCRVQRSGEDHGRPVA